MELITFKSAQIEVELLRMVDMKKLLQILFCLVLLLFAHTVSAKPLPSLTMKMHWVNEIAYDQPVKVKLEVSSQISSKDLKFELEIPAGVAIINGDTMFSREIKKGEPLRVDFTIIIDKGVTGKIKAKSSMGGAGQALFRASSQLTLGNSINPQKIGARATEPDSSFRHTERNGVKLREYKLP